MRNLFILLFTLTVISTNVQAEENFTWKFTITAFEGMHDLFRDSIVSPTFENPEKVAKVNLQEAQKVGAFLDKKVREFRNDTLGLSPTQEMIELGDHLLDCEGLPVWMFNHMLELLEGDKKREYERELYERHCKLDRGICRLEAIGMFAADSIYEEYNEYPAFMELRRAEWEQERARRLATPRFYVTETQVGDVTYVKSQIQDHEYEIFVFFPNDDTGQDYFALTTKFRNGHKAIDLAHCEGCPIKAIADGIVKVPRYHGILGWYAMTISEHIGMYFVYGHLSERTVRSGSTVHAGQQIGTEGHSGRTRGSKGDESVCLHLKATLEHSDGRKIVFDPMYLFEDYKNREMADAVYFKIDSTSGKAISKAEYLQAIQPQHITMN